MGTQAGGQYLVEWMATICTRGDGDAASRVKLQNRNQPRLRIEEAAHPLGHWSRPDGGNFPSTAVASGPHPIHQHGFELVAKQ